MKNQSIKSSILFFAILAITSCNKSKLKLPLSSFSKYVSGFTYGVISSRSHFEIEMQEPYSGAENVGDEVKTALFDFSPSIKGKTMLKTPNKLVFIPEKPLESNQSYEVRFDLGKALKSVDKKHKTFEYTVSTIKESATFIDEGINIISQTKQSKVFEYKGKILTADFTDANKVEENVKIDKKFPLVWSHSNDGLEHQFTIKNINAKEENQFINLDISLKNLTNPKSELKLTVPNKYDFLVTQVRLDPTDNNKIQIRFSEDVAQTGNEGLCSIDGNYNYQMQIVGNTITLSPNQNNFFGEVSILIPNTITSTFGKKLAKSKTSVLTIGNPKPDVKIVGNGNIVVDNNGAILPIKATGLNQLKVEVYKIYQNNVLYFLQNNGLQETYGTKRFGKKIHTQILKLNNKPGFNSNKSYFYNLDLSEMAALEKGAIYQVRLSYDRSMTSKYADGSKEKNKLFKFSMLFDAFQNDDESDYEDYDYEDYYDYYYSDNYDYEKRDDPSHDSYYNSSRFSKKNILISNVGMIVKKGAQNQLYISCVDLVSAMPLSGSTIEAFSYQFQPIGKEKTDGNGMANIKATDKPFFVVATHKGQKSYIKLDKYDAQSLDRFDVEGNPIQNGLNCYVYGERGVWRPGDKMHLTLLLSNGHNELPTDLPCMMELINPNGQTMDRQVMEKSVNGFYAFTTKTTDDAITGNWIARFKVGGLKYDKTVKIETIKPNRLRIVCENNEDVITNGTTIKYQTSWLNGANSSGLKATVDLNFYNAPVEFSGYKNYTFTDKTKQFSSFEQAAFDGNTQYDGSFSFKFNVEANSENIPGMLNVVSTTKVFENSGEFSVQYDTKKLAFYNSYVGYKMGANSEYYLNCGKNYTLQIANLDAKGKTMTNNKVKVGFYRVQYNWWYNSYQSNQYFDQNNIKSVVFEKEVNVINGKLELPIQVNNNQWGNYLIKITDLSSNHTTSGFFYFDSPYYNVDNTDANAKILQMSKDKNQYKVGETAKISLVSYFKGRALLSIENGSEVLESKWLDIVEGKNTIDFKIAENMSPNVYAYISAIQAHTQTGNGITMRMYGILPIVVDNSNSILKPIIKAPTKVEPEKPFEFTVSESSGRKMTYTVAIVDEGLLGVSGYKTPDPVKFFNGRQALGILTWDMFDYVIGAFTGIFRDVFSIGGDAESLSQMNKAKSNRYESVVKFLGPFELKSSSQKHKIEVPNYVGNLKIMVVAGGEKYSFGNATADVQVSKPLMVLGTLPRVLSMNEEIELPVNIFATEKSIKNVQVDVIVDDKLEMASASSMSVSMENQQDKIVNFKINTKQKQGITKIKIVAKSGKYNSVYEMEVPIRIANPPMVDYIQVTLNPNETQTIPVELLGVAGTNSLRIETATIPNLNIRSKVEQLLAYPHGCLEQTTSALFPQLYLAELTELNKQEQELINQNIKIGNEKYLKFQTTMGVLSYWPNSLFGDAYATAYAAHYLIEAKNKGFVIDQTLLNNVLDNMHSTANGFNVNHKESYLNTIQAYRLYVLALGGKSNLGAMNRLKEVGELNNAASIRLALAYSVLNNNNVATQLIAPIPMELEAYIDDRYTYSSEHIDNALLLELLIRIKDKTKAYAMFRKNIMALNSNNYLGTQSTAMLLKSITFYLSKNKVAPTNIEVSFNGKSYNLKGNKPTLSQTLDTKAGNITLTNQSSSVVVVNIVRKGTPLIVQTVNNNYIKLSVQYISKNGTTIKSDNIQRQTDFKQLIKITNTTNSYISNLALTNFVPAGWEIINKRIGGMESENDIDYQDIKDDRIYTYLSLKPNETKTIIQDFNASYEGQYTVPAMVLESMYNPSYKSVLGTYKTIVSR